MEDGVHSAAASDQRCAFLYPGQGTQHRGMGAWYRRASSSAEVPFEAASRIVGFDLARAADDFTPELLAKTENAQPLVFTCNAAAERLLVDRGVRPGAVAGHSLGEFNALNAAGVLDFEDAAALVAQRGRLMASVRAEGAMVSIAGLDDATLQDCCTDARPKGRVVIAAYNGPRNHVAAGDAEAVDACAALATQAGALKVTRLTTSNAFHSPLMEEVADRWAGIVGGLDLRPPTLPVALNAIGETTADVDAIREAMVAQLTQPVRWRECVAALERVATRFVECGESRVLTGFNRDLVPEHSTLSMSDPKVLRQIDRWADTGVMAR